MEIGGIDIADLQEDRLTRLRRERVGFVFQFFNLLPTLNVSENIALPLLLAGRPAGKAELEAGRLAGRVGIAHRLRHYPPELSGGELQRTAIARAVIHRPSLLIADEPTGNLDSENGLSVLRLLRELNTETGVAILLATHAPEVAAAAMRILRMRYGRIDGSDARPVGRKAEKMLEAFHFNLSALSYVALLVGLFLICNTVSVSVIARRKEIGALRAVGASRRTLLGFFVAEALTLGLAGCALALPLSRLLAYGAVALTSTTVSVFYRNIVAAPPSLDMQYVLLAFGTGLPLALAAGLVLANEASRISPAAAVRGADQLQARFRLKARHIWAPAVLLAAGVWLSLLHPIAGLPLFGFLSALAFMLGGASLTPAALHLLGRVGRRPMARLFRVEGLLAYSNLAGSIPRLAISCPRRP